MRSWLLGLGIAAGLAGPLACGTTCPSVFTGTSSSSSSTSSSGAVCEAGRQVACACGGEHEGVQVCAADGAAWGPCAGCGGAGGAGGSASSSSSSSGAQGGAGGAPVDAGPDAPEIADAAADGGPCPAWADVWAIFAAPAAGCTATGLCHGDGKGNLTLTSGDPAGGRAALMAWTIVKAPQVGKPYVVPGDPAGSGMLCNLKLDDGDGGTVNPWGECGEPMPALGALSPGQLQAIADWIACGAL